MSRPKSARLRMSLFASSSLVGSSLLAGVGGFVVATAPSAALAACTPTVAAGTTTYNCVGVDGSLLLNGAPTDTALTVNFNGDIVTGNVKASDTGATVVQTITVTAATGTNTITAAAGDGLTVDASVKGGAIVVSSTPTITAAGSGLVVKNAAGANTITVTNNVAGTAGAGVSITGTGVNILNVTGSSTVTGAGTKAAPAILISSGAGATTLNLGSPTGLASATATVPNVTIGSSLTGVAITAGTSAGTAGAVTLNLGRATGQTGVTAGTGTLVGVSHVTGTATLNGHVDFSGLTPSAATANGGVTMNVVGETQSAGVTTASRWNLGGGTSIFSSGADQIENRGIIQVSAAAATIDFGGPNPTNLATGLPSAVGNTSTVDRFFNRGATNASSNQLLYQGGSVNVIGANSALTLTGLEVFSNEGSSYLNIRNTANLSDFTTTASAQSFFMNPTGNAKTTGGKGDPGFSLFNITAGTIASLPTPAGASVTSAAGGVNLADGDVLDRFVITGRLTGNTSPVGNPYSAARLMIDVNTAARTADQLWVGDVAGGNVSIRPRFSNVTATNAAAYDPIGTLFMTTTTNVANDPNVLLDAYNYDRFASPQDAADQGLYRAYIAYRQGGGATSLSFGPVVAGVSSLYVDSNGNATDAARIASGKALAATGGYYLTFMPDTEFNQIASNGIAQQAALRDAQGTYFNRMADLRDSVGEQKGGVWARLTGNTTRRETTERSPGITALQNTLSLTYSQTTATLSVGVDGAGSVLGQKLVAGAAVGYIDSDVRHRASGLGGLQNNRPVAPVTMIPSYLENRTAIDGYTLGGYVSVLGENYFVDGSVNFGELQSNSLFASLNNTRFGSNSRNWIAKVQGGWRFVADDVFSLEPLAGLQYIRTTQDDIAFGSSVGATAVTFPTLESLQPGLGGRVKVSSATDLYKLNLGLSAMAWQELKEAGSRVKGTSNNQTFTVSNAYDGSKTLVELGLDADLYTANGLSAFFNVNYRSDFDAYQNTGVAVGGRWRW